MGYYHIRFIENSGILCMIILTWEGYCYKQLPMGITDFPENLQQKMNDLFRGFEFIRVYIDELLILTKGYCTDHVHKLELTLKNLSKKCFNAILKILSSYKPKGNIWVSG